MVYEVWNVVNIPAYPNQENPIETTARPAIIIEDLQDEVELCCLTKQVQQVSKYKYCFIVNKDSPEGIQMGLTFDSLVVVDRTVSLKKIRVIYKIGSCPQNIIDKIEELLRLKKEDEKQSK
ncbi:MAG: type II toxin-antitoxin system PemK/MazF family toxin [Bacteroidales bacterium]|nr:type II toxin-antitoxin system PemK/MazF family toxin [Bacteroidales bacterium]